MTISWVVGPLSVFAVASAFMIGYSVGHTDGLFDSHPPSAIAVQPRVYAMPSITAEPSAKIMVHDLIECPTRTCATYADLMRVAGAVNAIDGRLWQLEHPGTRVPGK